MRIFWLFCRPRGGEGIFLLFLKSPCGSCFLLTVCQALWQSAPRCNGCYWDWRSTWLHAGAFPHVLKWVSIRSVNMSAQAKHVFSCVNWGGVKGVLGMHVCAPCCLVPLVLRYKLQAVQWCLQDMHCLVALTFLLEATRAALGTHSWLLCVASCPQTCS